MRTLGRNDAVRSFMVAFAVIAAVVAASCDKVPLTSPTGSTILLSASTSIVPIDGSAEIIATVTESAGTAVQNGTTVVFRADLGRMDPQESQTMNGRAISRFFASGQSGVARINAYSGAAATGGSTPANSSAPAPGGPLTILVGGAAASRVTVRAEPPTIPQTGGTTQIFANVVDANGAPVIGAPVTFSVAAVVSGNTSGGGPGILSAPSTQTNANGVAQTSLTTNQTTTVKATVAAAGASGGTVTADVVVTALAAPTVSLTCTPPPAGFAVGIAVNCVVKPTPAGGVAIQNVTVNWGDGTGEQPVGNVTGDTTVSHIYSAPNTYTVTASATDLNSQRGTGSASVVVTRSIPPIGITGPATGTVGTSVSFVVTPPTGTAVVPTANVTVDFGDGTTRNLGAITALTTVNKAYGSAGNYIASATVTDTAGTRNTASTSILISGSAGPGVKLEQTGALSSGCGSFTLTLTPAPGTSIQSGSVKLDRTGGDLYTGTSSTTFAACGLIANDVLTARYTDSTGTTATTQLLVK